MSKTRVREKPATDDLVGSFRRFGSYGVVYEVLRIEDDQNAIIRVVESGEEASYPIRQILADPKA